jgi:hypothetical protein
MARFFVSKPTINRGMAFGAGTGRRNPKPAKINALGRKKAGQLLGWPASP